MGDGVRSADSSLHVKLAVILGPRLSLLGFPTYLRPNRLPDICLDYSLCFFVTTGEILSLIHI